MQESNGGTNTQGKQLPRSASWHPKILLFGWNFLIWIFSFIEIWLKYRTACQDHHENGGPGKQSPPWKWESVVKWYSLRTQQNGTSRFWPRPCRSQSRRFSKQLDLAYQLIIKMCVDSIGIKTQDFHIQYFNSNEIYLFQDHKNMMTDGS